MNILKWHKKLYPMCNPDIEWLDYLVEQTDRMLWEVIYPEVASDLRLNLQAALLQ